MEPTRILYPPRPKGRMLHAHLPEYEQTGKWLAQRKFNGVAQVIYISTDRKVYFYNRHNEKNDKIPAKLVADFSLLHLKDGVDYWLNGEFLSPKTTNPDFKGKLVLYDVLHVGRLLFQSPILTERLEILVDICGHPKEYDKSGIALKVGENLWLAETFMGDFVKHFHDKITMPEIEGLVLKQKASVIDNFGNKEYETNWLIRCRKPHQGGNYAF